MEPKSLERSIGLCVNVKTKMIGSKSAGKLEEGKFPCAICRNLLALIPSSASFVDVKCIRDIERC